MRRGSFWLVAIIGVLILFGSTSCGPGQVFGPTLTPTKTVTKTKTQTPTKLSNLCAGRFIAPTTHKGVNMTVVPTGDVITILSPANIIPSCGQMNFAGIPAYMC